MNIPGSELDLLDPQRTAHSSIRGYLYQVCWGVLRWLELKPREALLCEGDEDLDQFLLRGRVSEQVKAYTGGLNIADRVVRDSLRRFLVSYVSLSQKRRARRFIFTTLARKKRLPAWSATLLEDWANGNRAPKTLADVQNLLNPEERHKHFDEIRNAIIWLDQQPDGWKNYMDAVEFQFEAPGTEEIRQRIRTLLNKRPEARHLQPEILIDRLVVHCLEASSKNDVAERLLSHKDLTQIIRQARADLESWALTRPAERIRDLFEEETRIRKVLFDNIGELPPVGEGHDWQKSPPFPISKALIASYEVIPFDENSRSEELSFLAEWCMRVEPRSVLVVSGDGGSGKTRLLLEWCHRIRHQGWVSGFLRPDCKEGQLDWLIEGPTPKLIVVDYAESQPSIVESLLVKIGLEIGNLPRLRLVLLTRRAGAWWDRIRSSHRIISDVNGHSLDPLALKPLSLEENQRIMAFYDAIAAFSKKLSIAYTLTQISPDLSHKNHKHPLYIQMAALLTLLGAQPTNNQDLLRSVLEHESRFWNFLVRGLRLDVPQESNVLRAIRITTAAVALKGGIAKRTDAEDLIRKISEKIPLRIDLVTSIIEIMKILYGGSADKERSLFLEPLQPDILAEELIRQCLLDDKEILSEFRAKPEIDLLAITARGENYAARSALVSLARLARSRPEAERWLRSLLADRLEELIETAIEVATEVGDPMGSILARVIAESDSKTILRKLNYLLAEGALSNSVPLREIALVAAERNVFSMRSSSNSDLGFAEKVEFARLTKNLSRRLRDLGRLEDALKSAHEAVEIYKHIAEIRPDALRPDLASSLDHWGIMLHDIGRQEEALYAVEQALQIRRQLVQRRPDAFLPDLASSLNNFGTLLIGLSRREEALQASSESVSIYRQLAQNRPDVFLADLASSLDTLATILRDFGQQKEALGAIDEALHIRRQLAERRPDAFLPDLALSLNNMGLVLGYLGRREDALKAAEEAVEIRKRLAHARPDAFLPDLAMSLNNLGNVLSDLGRQEDALQATKEAVRSLSPFFLRLPAASATWMTTMVRNYLKRAEAAGQEPDESLLTPILEVLQSLSPTPPPDAQP